jgi:hypothetical protein
MKTLQMTLIALVLILSPVYAVHAHSIKVCVFKISYADMLYMYWNDADEPKEIRLYVDAQNEGKPGDTVVLDCNGKDIYVEAGSWAKCNVAAHKKVSFTIPKKNFENGAYGESKRWY